MYDRLRDFSTAAGKAKEKYNVLLGKRSENMTPEEVDMPAELVKRFFELQVECEQTGAMNYREYARRLWQEKFGEVPPSGPVFDSFEADLITGLHDIDMQGLIYPDVQNNLDKIVAALYGPEGQVKRVTLWSTGDAEATGYQHAKIASSRIVRSFLAAAMANKTALASVRDGGTEYMVRDNKLADLKAHLLARKARGENSIKLAVVEDSKKNILAVEALVKEIFGENGTVVPVWAVYSREGQNARKADASQFTIDSERLNAIDSFAELASPKLAQQLHGAEVLVDFDGVLGDNIRMRQRQASATYRALSQAALKLNIGQLS